MDQGQRVKNLNNTVKKTTVIGIDKHQCSSHVHTLIALFRGINVNTCT